MLEDPHGIVGAEHVHRTGEPDAFRARGDGSQHHGGGRGTEAVAVMLAQAKDMQPYLVGERDLFDRFAAWLRRNGVRPGDRVAVYGKNTEVLATAIFGASRADAVVVVLNWRLQVEELAYILWGSGATALFHDPAFAGAAEALKAQTDLQLLAQSGAEFAAVMADDSLTDPPEPMRRGADPATLMYTSGTTGKPKSAILTYGDFLAAGHGASSTIDWFASHRFLLVAPIFHIGGLMPLTTSVQKGDRIVFAADFDPAAIWDLIARERITTMMTVPAMLSALLMVAARMEVDASSLANMTCGASAAPLALIEGAAKLGFPVQQVYGMTELTGSASFWKPEMDPAKGHSHVKPAYLNRLRVTDPESGEPLPVGAADLVWGEVPVAFVVGEAGADLTEAAVIDECRKHLAGFKGPKSLRFVNQLPRNGAGKVVKPRLRDLPTPAVGN